VQAGPRREGLGCGDLANVARGAQWPGIALDAFSSSTWGIEIRTITSGTVRNAGSSSAGSGDSVVDAAAPRARVRLTWPTSGGTATTVGLIGRALLQYSVPLLHVNLGLPLPRHLRQLHRQERLHPDGRLAWCLYLGMGQCLSCRQLRGQ